jgi:hypothetical protein
MQVDLNEVDASLRDLPPQQKVTPGVDRSSEGDSI